MKNLNKLKKTAGLLFLFFLLSVTLIRGLYASPSVFRTGTTIFKPLQAYKGYILFRAVVNNNTRIIMMDMQGNIAHYWENPYYHLGYAEPLTNGNILCSGYHVKTNQGLIEFDWDGNVVWEYFGITNAMPHHDFERLENGNTLILYREYKVVPEISSKPIYDDFIVEVNPQGQILWQWHTYEHFSEFGFSDEAKQLIYETGGDWAHANSISVLPDNSLNDQRFKKGNILVSQRETNIIFIISKETGKIVWKIGPDNNLTIGQHDAKMIPQGYEGAGNILLFDNGGEAGYPVQARFYSRVIEIEPINKKIIFGYNAFVSHLPYYTFFSYSTSGVQKLPNGNILIDEGDYGRFFQVTPSGEIVWEYINPYFEISEEMKTNKVYRIWLVDINWPPLQ